MKSVNLIPTPRRDAKRRRGHRRNCAAVCGAYALMLAGAVGVAHVMLSGTGRVLDEQLASADNEIRRYQQQSDAARRELATARATIEASRTVSEQPDWSVLLTLLAKTMSDDVVLRGITVGPPVVPALPTPAGANKDKDKAPPDAVLEIMGVGRTQLAVSRHVLRLEQTGLFSKVTLVDTGREKFLKTNSIGFRLQCTFGEPKQPTLASTPAAAAAAAAPKRPPQSVTSTDAGGITR